jgi:hypothetical protein
MRAVSIVKHCLFTAMLKRFCGIFTKFRLGLRLPARVTKTIVTISG